MFIIYKDTIMIGIPPINGSITPEYSFAYMNPGIFRQNLRVNNANWDFPQKMYCIDAIKH